jgi:hypothetical protein
MYVYVLQSRLAELGISDVKPNGYLTRSTLKFVATFCSQKEIANICRKGPLQSEAADALVKAIWE